MPAVVKLPSDVSAMQDWQKGGFNRSFTTCMDIVPTFLDLINVSLPPQESKTNIPKALHRDKVVHGMMGKSWLPYALHGTHPKGETSEEYGVYSQQQPVGWELMARAALRKGDFKIVHVPRKFKGKADPKIVDDPDGWELFNVIKDPGETDDLGEKQPAKLKELIGDFEQYTKDCGVVWGPTAEVGGEWVNQAPWLYDDDQTWQRAWLQTPHGQPLKFDTYKPPSY